MGYLAGTLVHQMIITDATEFTSLRLNQSESPKQFVLLHKVKSPQMDKQDEILLAAAKLADVLKSPSVSPLFADNNNTATALTQLSDIFLSKLKSTSPHDKTLVVPPNTATTAIPSSPRVSMLTNLVRTD